MVFKNRSLKFIFYIVLAVGILIPLFNIYFIYPSFTSFLLKSTEDDALRTATHLMSMFKKEFTKLNNYSTSDYEFTELMKKLDILKNDYHFEKLQFSLENGEILYSTEPKEVGRVQNDPLFYDLVSKRNPYTKVVKKDFVSFKYDEVGRDILETYIPIINSENTLIGNLKVSYDITSRANSLNNVLLKASFVPFGMMLCGLVITIFILMQLDKSITKQKKVEEELRFSAERLYHSNQELENFAYIASHDLQEPLRKIVAFGDRLIKCSQDINEQGRDYLDRMQSAARRMQTLINGLLSFSRVSTKGISFMPVDLGKVTREVVTDLEVRISQSKGHVEVSDLITINADPIQMHQLIQNLIGNALKFSKANTPPHIKIHGKVIKTNSGNGNDIASEKEFYQLSVEDNGIGFDEKYTDKIFDIFQRLHGRKDYEGSGIGLSICRKIVDRHNGTITVKSSLGKGASFLINLPIQQPKGGNNGHK